MRRVIAIIVLFGLIILVAAVEASAWADGLLVPNGMQQFVDSNGAPLSGGQVFTYIPGTTTPKATYLNPAQTVTNQNPITLDAAGRAIIWGSGSYRQVLQDQFGSLVWDQITSVFDASSLTGSTLTNITLAGTTTIVGPATAVTVSCSDNSTNIATTAFVACALGTPLITRTSTSKTASYTVGAGDAGKVIVLNSAGTGGQTITVPSLATLGVSNFSITLCNQDVRAWNITSVDAGTLRLYPGAGEGQCNTLYSNGSALKFLLPFQRFQGRTIYVGPSGSCSDGNDGLKADSSGQLCSFNTAISRIQSDFDTLGTSAQIIPAAGNYTEQVFFAGYVVGGGDQISINPSGDIVVTNGGSGATFGTRDGGVLTLDGTTHSFEIGCVGGIGAQATQYSTIDALDVTIASCDGGNAFGAGDTGHLNISGTTTFVGSNAVALFVTSNAGSLITLAGTVNFASGTSDSFVMEAVTGGVLAYEGGAVSWTNTGNLAGAAQYVVQTAGGIATGGNLGAIPGTPGTSTAPGWVQ